YSDQGMIGALTEPLEAGRIQFFCIDSVDGESWYNKGIHPAAKVIRHMQYESYVSEEVMPFLRGRNWSPRIGVTGCSFGAYHAVNYALKNPDVITDCVSMSGAFDIRQFLNGYYDDNCYFNNPVDFIPGLNNPLIWQRHLVLAAGDWDICLGDNYRLAQLLGTRNIPHTLDVWGSHQKHDWPLWRQMARKFFA
ncbi:MAG: alpha/beta hydrolase-fold protein, partial [Acidobacteriota bacterium]|nr:alpha/beta hydrolase-fold protein [Acidobacteriota bacterium]